MNTTPEPHEIGDEVHRNPESVKVEFPESLARRVKEQHGETVDMEKFAEHVRKMADELGPFPDQLRESVAGLRVSIGLFQQNVSAFREQHPEIFEPEKPVHPGTVRDESGIKKPSTVTPIWANQPNKRRRS